MDGHLILTAKKDYTASQTLEHINKLMFDYWKTQGYKVDEHGIIGKKNGVDNPDACRTTAWAEILTAPDGTEYFSSLSNESRIIDWKAFGTTIDIPDCFEEIEKPVEWIVEDV
ncbi:MAG: hypothetical protein KAJ40_00420 [Alphaproteobacteria bacterium]|nr:hypothetical protein [Alphaproteobacteria bacterium]